MSNDDFQLPELPSGPDSLLDELQVRSRDDVRWSGLWKVVHLADWKNRIQVRQLRSVQSCQPTGITLTNVYLPQGVVVTLDSIGQVKEYGSTEWYFVYLAECDLANTSVPTTGAGNGATTEPGGGTEGWTTDPDATSPDTTEGGGGPSTEEWTTQELTTQAITTSQKPTTKGTTTSQKPTTKGTTTSQQPTTVAPSTTSWPEPTTTTCICPVECGDCTLKVSMTLPALCPDAEEFPPCLGGLVVWQQGAPGSCVWMPIIGPGDCIIGPLSCVNGFWRFYVGCLDDCACLYQRCAQGEDDCPPGEYHLASVPEGNCAGCDGTLTIVSGAGG